MLEATSAMINGRTLIPDSMAVTPLIAWNQTGKKYTSTVNDPLIQNANHVLAVTLRYRRIRRGSVAFSCFQTCTPANAIIRIPKKTQSTMIRASFQAYVDPPSSNASKRHTIPGRKHIVPSGLADRLSLSATAFPLVFPAPFYCYSQARARTSEAKSRLQSAS
jgi:hypothetical protein